MGNDMFNEEQLAYAADTEAARERASLATRLYLSEREIAGAHHLLTMFGIPEQMPPFKTALAPLAVRLRRLNALRDIEVYLAARAKASHVNDTAALHAEIDRLLRRIAELTVALRPLAALAPAYEATGLDGAAILTVQLPDPDGPKNIKLMPADAALAAALIAEGR